jgi:hypothetical protein
MAKVNPELLIMSLELIIADENQRKKFREYYKELLVRHRNLKTSKDELAATELNMKNEYGFTKKDMEMLNNFIKDEIKGEDSEKGDKHIKSMLHQTAVALIDDSDQDKELKRAFIGLTGVLPIS